MEIDQSTLQADEPGHRAPSPADIDGYAQAACLGKIATIESFLQRWPDFIDVKDNKSWTALMHAAWSNHEDIVVLLLQKGADLRVKDRWGRSAWVLAKKRGCRSIVILIEEGLKKIQ
jgi:ankyrin repeat protein